MDAPKQQLQPAAAFESTKRRAQRDGQGSVPDERSGRSNAQVRRQERRDRAIRRSSPVYNRRRPGNVCASDRKQIDDLGIAKGELFAITKAEKENGTRRPIEWQVTVNGRAGNVGAGELRRAGSSGVEPVALNARWLPL